MQFILRKEQIKKLNEWIFKNHPDLENENHGAIGGFLTYSFTPTSLGNIEKVRDSILDIEIDLTEYDWW